MKPPGEVRFFHRRFDELTRLELYDLLWLRNEVFVVGQKITAEPEVDGLDPECVHVIGLDAGGRTVATARLFVDRQPVKVGRVAVARDRQGRGIGSALMCYIHELIGERGGAMSAQEYLRGWYEGLGWVVDGDGYDEAGIPHVHMVRRASGVIT